MNILVFSRMFPSKRNETAGIFLARFLGLLRPRTDNIVVVSPRVYVPWPLSWRPRWSTYTAVPRHDQWGGMNVVRPSGFYVRASWYRSAVGWMNGRACRETVGRLHDQIGFDVALGWPVIPDGDTLVRLADSLRIPAVIWSLGSDLNSIAGQSSHLKAAARRVLEKSALVLTSSRALAERAHAIAPRARRIEPFHRGIDLTLFDRTVDRTTVRRRLGLPVDAHVVACVGRLSREKGIVEALDAFGRLRERRPDVHLALAGDDLMGPQLDDLIERTGAAERVARLGVIPPDRAIELLEAADVLLFASHSEGLPNVPLEAMAAGTAVVSTRVGGVPEFLTDGENALLVPVGDVSAIAAALERLLGDDDLRRRLARAGKLTVRHGFDARRNGEKFLRMLVETTAER